MTNLQQITKTAEVFEVEDKTYFIKRSLIVLIILIGVGLGKTKAQDIEYDWDNTLTSCDWTVTLYDGSSNLLYGFTMYAGSSSGRVCVGNPGAAVAYIEFTNTTLGSFGLDPICPSLGCIYAQNIVMVIGSCGGANPTDRLLVAMATSTACLSPTIQSWNFTALP